MADIISLERVKEGLAPIALAAIVEAELFVASDLLDQGKDPIEVAKALIKALQEIVDVSTQ